MSFSIDKGQLIGARQCPSPNHTERPAGVEVDLLVLHSISLPPGCFGGTEIEQFFCNQLNFDEHPYFNEIRGMEVSAHLLIRRDGEVVQFVNFERRAWHAGTSWFQGRGNCNDFSIGIELEGSDDARYNDAQYAVLAELIALLVKHYPIPRHHLVGHSQIAPGRKSDPGPHFNWQRLHALLAKKTLPMDVVYP